MSTYSKYLINEHALHILPSVAIVFGFREAAFLQQLHYLMMPRPNWQPELRQLENDTPRHWIYAAVETKAITDDDKPFVWYEILQHTIPAVTIKRIIKKLRDLEVVIATDQFNGNRYNRKLWYTINYEKFEELMDNNPKVQSMSSEPLYQNDTVNSVKVIQSESVKMIRSKKETNKRLNKDIGANFQKTEKLALASPPQIPETEKPNPVIEPFVFSISELRALELSKTEWAKLLKNEIDRKKIHPKFPRKGVVALVNTKMSQHPALDIYRDIAHLSIPECWRQEVVDTVGEKSTDLEFWGDVIKHYIGKYPNKANIIGMMDFYKRRELPGTNHNGNGYHEPEPNRTPEETQAIKAAIAEMRAT